MHVPPPPTIASVTGTYIPLTPIAPAAMMVTISGLLPVRPEPVDLPRLPLNRRERLTQRAIVRKIRRAKATAERAEQRRRNPNAWLARLRPKPPWPTLRLVVDTSEFRRSLRFATDQLLALGAKLDTIHRTPEATT